MKPYSVLEAEVRGKKPLSSVRRPKPRFPGICRDAKALGVNRVTLYRVLTGEWKGLKGLKARYEKLKQEHGE